MSDSVRPHRWLPLECGINENSCQDLIKHFKHLFQGKKERNYPKVHTYNFCVFLDVSQESFSDNLQLYKSMKSASQKAPYNQTIKKSMMHPNSKAMNDLKNCQEFFMKNEFCPGYKIAQE